MWTLAVLVLLTMGAAGRVSAAPGDLHPDARWIAEGQALLAREAVYLQKRIAGDLEGIYAFQHPEYRKRITFDEFRFYDGRVVFNFRELAREHISGAQPPSLEEVRRQGHRTDPLGFPAPVIYKWFPHNLFTLQKHFVESVSISADGKHAMVTLKLEGKEKLPPFLRFPILFDTTRKYADYWEKVNGRWYITLLADAARLSGNTVEYLIPNGNAAWQTLEWIEIDPRQLESEAPGQP
ncbi:MAG: hypothetical protein COV67_01925 [Nitrospinae bacterium CG11_big_fil_rev_8_21_14_0_20_56_8]|nr:MAG: hypothetical protein COV67_01925 [Nitrospinae bacterium CG11_big_fil_rev_8_21_14_0_20_56_8]